MGCLFCASLFDTEIINSKDSNGSISSNTNSVSCISFIAALVFCRVTMFHHLNKKKKPRTTNQQHHHHHIRMPLTGRHDRANRCYYWRYINTGDPCDLCSVDR